MYYDECDLEIVVAPRSMAGFGGRRISSRLKNHLGVAFDVDAATDERGRSKDSLYRISGSSASRWTARKIKDGPAARLIEIIRICDDVQ